jgi:hypothetical protein
MSKKKLLAFLALLSVQLYPSIALADVGEGVVESIGNMLWGKIKTSVVPYLELGTWGYVASFFCMALTMAWLWRFKPKGHDLAHTLGRTVGPFAIIGFIFAIGWAILGMAIGMVKGFITGSIVGVLHSLPIIGTLLGWFPRLSAAISGLIAAIVSLAFAIGIVIFAIKSAGSLVKQIFDAISSIIKGGVSNPTTGFKIAGTLAIAVLINRPEWNMPVYGAFSIVSSIFGLVILIKTTAEGQLFADRAGAKLLHKPRESDGAWKCPNKGKKPKLDKNLEPIPILDASGKPKRNKRGKIMIQSVDGPCKGPQGELDGVKYDGWNPKEVADCLSPTCDHPNPFWVKCEECGFAGKEGKGFERKPAFAGINCPKCGHFHEKVPRTTPFHLPGKDKSNLRKLKAKKAAETVAAAAATVPAPAVGAAQPQAPAVGSAPVFDPSKIELDFGTDLLVGPRQYHTGYCPSCERDLDPYAHYSFCPYCDHEFTAKSKAKAEKPKPKPKSSGPGLRPHRCRDDMWETT